MAWVKTVDESEAQGDTAEFYNMLKKAPFFGGRVPNVIKSLSLRPQAMQGVYHMSSAISFGGSSLGRVREEMIATAVSAVNKCHY